MVYESPSAKYFLSCACMLMESKVKTKRRKALLFITPDLVYQNSLKYINRTNKSVTLLTNPIPL
jgi:hypothetical protein